MLARTCSRTRRALHSVGALLSAALLGCTPSIGDECQTSIECSATGERLCDTTMKDGYCTVLGCTKAICPDEAVCIAFSHVASPVTGCDDASGTSRFERTACMLSCDDADDCRDGYDCVDMREPNAWGAIVAEEAGVSGKVCVVKPRGVPQDPDHENGVCTGGAERSGG